MGHELSRIVDSLHPLPESKRVATLDRLLQDKTFYKEIVEAAQAQNFGFTLHRTSVTSKPTASQTLEPSRTIDSKTIETWSNDLSVFWKSSQYEFDPWSGDLANFYDNTLNVEQNHGLYAIRRRFMKLFYCDLLGLLNPLAACGKAGGEIYHQLANIIARKGEADRDIQLIQSNLTAWVRAGRRYHKLAANFGTAILFVLPDSLSIDFLEKRLPLKDNAFQTATQQFGSLKEHADKLDGDRKIAEQLRTKNLAPYTFLIEQFRKSTKRKANPYPPRRAWKSRNQPKHAAVRTRSTSTSSHSPTTPCEWEHVYHLQGSRPGHAPITDQANKHLNSPETAQATHVNGAAFDSRDVSFDHHPDSSIQLGNERTLKLFGAGTLPLAVVTGVDDWGVVEHAVNDLGRQYQDIGQYATDQRVTKESSDMAVPDRTEKTPQTTNNNEVQCDDPMLSDLTAEDWERDVRLFRPVPFNPGAFAPVSFDSDPFLGTSRSPI